MRFLFGLVFEANWLHAVIFLVLLWLGLIFWALGTTAVDGWGTIAYALSVGIFLACVANFADTYSDRFEDRIHKPSNPMVSGDFSIETGRKIFIAENIIGLVLVGVLLGLTRNYPLTLVLIAAWVGGLMYSLPPFRLKGRKFIGPLEFGLCCGLLPLIGWLIVKPIDNFILALALVLFIGGWGVGITTKLRRTAEDLNAGVISASNLFHLRTTDFGLKVKNALILEAILVIAALCLIPVFGWLGVFDQTLVTYLLSFTAPLVLIGLALRGKNPVGNLKIAQASFVLLCATLPAISIAIFVAAIVHFG